MESKSCGTARRSLSIRHTLALLFTLPTVVVAAGAAGVSARESIVKRDGVGTNGQGYANPADAGGSMLTVVQGTSPPGQGEPLNMIISGNSDKEVLVDQQNSGGLRNYFLSLHMSAECLGQHEGLPQQANLGDGNGLQNETAVIRFNYGDPQLGSCQETIKGGDHFRYWVQNGKDQKTSAVFMAVSYEKPIAQGHDLILNSYNYGRDWIVGNITNQTVPTLTLNTSYTIQGPTYASGYTYVTNVTYVAGLLQNTSIGINHNETVPLPGMNTIDGLVAVLEVHITEKPASSSLTVEPSTPAFLITIITLVISALGAISI